MKYNKEQSGWIEVICGPMFAGKTEELIRRVRRMDFAKKNILFSNRRLTIGTRQQRWYRTINVKLKPFIWILLPMWKMDNGGYPSGCGG